MAAFTYQQQHPNFHIDSLFMSNNCFINPIYFPSMPDSSSVQIDNVQLIGEKIEPCLSDKTKQISTTDTPTSSINVDLEGDDQVIHSQEKTNPPMEKKKRKILSCFDSDNDVKQRSKPKKQRKCDLEVKEEKKSKVDKKKKKKDVDDVKAAAVLGDHKQTDYVHVRARRGQANDSHSLAERVRREKISERLKMLQSLVPGCDKVNSKAHMLEEIINYVQSLQVQVEMLSMKLAYMNPVFYDFGVDLDDFFQKPTLATSSPLSLTTTHQDSMTHAPTTTSTTTTPTEFANVTPTFSSTSNDTSAIPLHENSVSFSPLQQEVHQQKLNDFSQVLLQQQEQELPNNEELLCYMNYYHLHHRQEGATNLFYYE